MDKPQLLDVCVAACVDVAGFVGVAADVFCTFVGDETVGELLGIVSVVAGLEGDVGVGVADADVAVSCVVAGAKSDIKDD